MINKKVKLIKTKLFASLIIFAASFSGCAAQTRLPREMPADATMRFNSNGGMTPYYTDIEIEGDTLLYKKRMPPNHQPKTDGK